MGFIWIESFSLTLTLEGEVTPLLKAFDYSSELTNWSLRKPAKAFLMCPIIKEELTVGFILIQSLNIRVVKAKMLMS